MAYDEELTNRFREQLGFYLARPYKELKLQLVYSTPL